MKNFKLILFILLLPFFAYSQVWVNGSIQRLSTTGQIRYLNGANLDTLIRLQLNSLSNLDMLRYNSATGKFIPINSIITKGLSKQTRTDINQVFAGDSRVTSVTGETAWPTALMTLSNFTNQGTAYNVGVGGSTITDLINSYTATVYPKRPTGGITQSNLFVLTGINDLVQAVNPNYTLMADSLLAYCAQAKADGFTVVLLSEFYGASLSTVQEIARQNFNDRLRAGYSNYSFFIDLENILLPAASDIFYQDTAHLTTAGNYLVAQYINEKFPLGNTGNTIVNRNQSQDIWTPISGIFKIRGGATITGTTDFAYLVSNTATNLTSPSATNFSGIANPFYGGVIAGFGTDYDAALFSRANFALGVEANTTTVAMRGNVRLHNIPGVSGGTDSLLSKNATTNLVTKIPASYYATSSSLGSYLPLAGGTMVGNIIATDNTYDIGASGATRFRTGYFGTSVIAPSFVGALTGNATTATTATNLAGGSGGTISYQSAAGTTAMLANGTAGYILQANGTTLAPSWVNPATSEVTSITGTANQVIASSSTGAVTLSLPQSIGTGSTPTFSTVTATTFTGALSGNATTATTATNATNVNITDDNSTNSNYYPVWTTTTGNLPLKISSSRLGFNPSSGALALTGSLTVTRNTSAAYAVQFYNQSATGAGLGIQAGSTSGQTALSVYTYNGGSQLFSVFGDGHIYAEGVTSTGATGSGNLMFSDSPTTTGTFTSASQVFTGSILSNTTQNLVALSSTNFTTLANSSYGAVTTGYGSSYDVGLFSRGASFAFGVVAGSNNVVAASLAGTGSRAVIADANGQLSAPVSDLTVKQKLTPIGYGINEIMLMKPQWGEYRDGWKNYGEGRQNFNIAQDMQKIIPEAVFLTPSTGKLGINYDQLQAVYIKAIQELQQEIIDLKKTNKLK